MGKHRFIGDTDGSRDHRGNLIAQPASVLCAVCGATPDDPECICAQADSVGAPEGEFVPNPILLVPDTAAGAALSDPPVSSEPSYEGQEPETPPADTEAPPADSTE